MITFAKFDIPIHTLLESDGIKLGLVTTNILGALRRAIPRPLVTGERDGAVLTELEGVLLHKRA